MNIMVVYEMHFVIGVTGIVFIIVI